MKVSYSLLITYTGFFLGYFLNKYLTHHLDLDGLGDFRAGLSLASIFAVIITFGGSGSAKKFIPAYVKDGKFGEVSGLLRYYSSTVIKLSALLTLIYFLLLLVITQFELEVLRHEAMSIVLLAPLLAFSMLLGSTLQARHKSSQAIIPHELLKPALFLLFIFVWLKNFGSPSLIDVISIFALTILLTLILQVFLVKIAMPFNLFREKAIFKISEWKKVGLPLLYSTVANSFLARIDILSLEILHTSEKEVGVFCLLIFIVSVVWLNFTSTINVITPQIAEADHDSDTLQRIYNKSFTFMLISNLIVGTLIWIFSDDILRMMSEGLLDYKNWFLLLLLAACFNSSFEVPSAFLRFTGHHQQAKQNTTLVMTINLILTPILIIFMGMEGAIIALVFTRFIRAINYTRLMHKHIGIKPLIFV